MSLQEGRRYEEVSRVVRFVLARRSWKDFYVDGWVVCCVWYDSSTGNDRNASAYNECA
jgi:hypothetical protein